MSVPGMNPEEWDRITALEAENEDLRARIAVAVGNPCASCQAENERLRKALAIDEKENDRG